MSKSAGDPNNYRDDWTYDYNPNGQQIRETLDFKRGGGSTVTLRKFRYDPFGRLTAVFSDESETNLIAEYRYNGLGQRIMWRYDANFDKTVGSTERYHFMYDDRWRVVGVFRDADSTPKESFVYHAAGNAGRGSSSYIDSVILRDRDANGGGGWTGASDGTLEERRFYTQNWRADVVAITKSDGNPLEYVFYSAYGEATVHPIADVDMDGDVDSADATAWDNGDNLGAGYNYHPAGSNLNWDDKADAADDALFDESYATNVGLSGKGRVSSSGVGVGVGNRKGYAGYEHDESIAMYHVRHRVYRPDLGRWMTRDPLGYVDGMGLYEYVRGMAVIGVDPQGKAIHVPAAVGAGCLFGGLGGGFADGAFCWLSNGGNCASKAFCGALGGCVTGACIAAVISLPGPWSVIAGCLCGVIGSAATTACNAAFGNGFDLGCAMYSAITAGVLGCIGGALDVDDLTKLIQAVVGFDVAMLNNWCNPAPTVVAVTPGAPRANPANGNAKTVQPTYRAVYWPTSEPYLRKPCR